MFGWDWDNNQYLFNACFSFQDLLPSGYKYHVSRLKVFSSEANCFRFSAEIRIPISSADGAKEWVSLFQALTRVTLRGCAGVISELLGKFGHLDILTVWKTVVIFLSISAVDVAYTCFFCAIKINSIHQPSPDCVHLSWTCLIIADFQHLDQQIWADDRANTAWRCLLHSLPCLHVTVVSLFSGLLRL